MNIIVIGAGIIGSTTARALLADGHDVTVLDEAAQAGVGTSKANGAQLSYSFVAPLADPSVLGKLPGWLTRRDAPLRLRLRADPAQWRWALSFLAACRRDTAARTTAELLQLGLHSRRLTRALVQDGALSCDFSASGKLLVYQDAAAFAGARAQMHYQASLGCEQHALGRDECLAWSPRWPISASAWSAASTRPARTRPIARRCARPWRAGWARGCGWARAWRRLRGGAVQALETSAGEMQADAYVVANGVGAQALCRQAGLQPLIYPLKGYSLTYALGPDSSAPRTSLSDVHNKVVYARLGDRLRVAGMVDIGDRDAGIDGGRIHQLKEQVRRYLPRLAPAGEPEAWAGLRPARPDGKPLIGRTPVRGLWINAGHGALGFTLAAGSAGVLADRIAGRPSPISDTLFQW